MSDAPDWSNIPPPEFDDRGGPAGGGGRGGRGGRGAPPAMTPDEILAASLDFYEWLESPATAQQLKILLPDHVDPPVFISTAKTAVFSKPQLLREDYRPSLIAGIMKAAGMGLLPDGKQGVLIPRYDFDTKKYLIAWQPMIWGVVKLGRETGAIRAIRAVLVFYGEKFRIIQGEEDLIEHEVDPDIVDAAYAALNAGRDANGNPLSKPVEFIKHVRAAYCLITGMDGTITRRWMTKNRLISLWESTRAEKGPWSGRWVDEMFLKGMILFTAKWINLDPTSAAAKRFQAAMLADLEIDFDRQDDALAVEAPAEKPEPALLAAPGNRLGTLEELLAKKVREPVPRTEPPSQRHPGTLRERDPAKAAKAAATANGAATPRGRAAEKKAPPPPTDAEVPFIDRVSEALMVDGGMGYRWMKALEAATRTCPAMDTLAALHAVPSVGRNLRDAPAAVRTQIDKLFRDAADRLGNPATDDGWPGPDVDQAA